MPKILTTPPQIAHELYSLQSTAETEANLNTRKEDFSGIIVCGWFCIFTVYVPLLGSLVICGIVVSGCGLFFSA